MNVIKFSFCLAKSNKHQAFIYLDGRVEKLPSYNTEPIVSVGVIWASSGPFRPQVQAMQQLATHFVSMRGPKSAIHLGHGLERFNPVHPESWKTDKEQLVLVN